MVREPASRVDESVCMSEHGPTAANPLLHVCCCGPATSKPIDCCISGVQRANAGSTTFSACVRSCTLTCHIVPRKKLSMDRQHAFHYSLVQLDLPETVLCVQKRPKSTFESTVLISQISCGVPAGACEPCRHRSHRIWPSGAKRDRRYMLYAHASVSASNHRKRPKTPRVFSLMLLLQDGGQVGRVYICSRYLLIFSGLL